MTEKQLFANFLILAAPIHSKTASMSKPFKHLKAIVFDWAGTTVDFGSRAPAIVFQAIFSQRGIEITQAQAREPMGMAKRDHIEAISEMPEVAAAWQETFGSVCSDQDIDAMYADFLPLQKETLKHHSNVIDGVVESVRVCRERGLKIGSSTGYTHELMDVVTPLAAAQGYEPDTVLCSEDAHRGRPAPFLLFEAAKRLDVFPLWHFVKVDDTVVGIEAGRNAGCWTIGVTRTGNAVGLSEDELSALSGDEVRQRCDAAKEKFTLAGAHFVIESVADVLGVLDEIEQRLANGDVPL